ncbi:MAG: stage II sporulation protein R [Oscillospiraceae bacterium]
MNIGKNTIDLRSAVAFGLVFTILLSFVRFDAQCQEIRENVLRLHVLANSDETYDQDLKLKVRDELLKVSDSCFSESITEQEALAAAKENLELLESTAKKVIREENFSYDVKVEIGKAHFDTRVYDNFTLPAGEYEAVRVLIGEAKGKNWWCVMFPPVCVPAAMPEHTIGEVLSEEQSEIVGNPSNYEIRFKTVEVFEKVKDFFKSKIK